MSGIRWGLLPFVLFGGVLGVSARELLLLPGDADGTLVVLSINVLGSGLLGVATGAVRDRHARVRAFVGTGVLGGFTTYSGFALQSAQWLGPSPLWAASLVAASLTLGVVAAAVGVAAGRGIARRGRGDLDDPRAAE